MVVSQPGEVAAGRAGPYPVTVRTTIASARAAGSGVAHNRTNCRRFRIPCRVGRLLVSDQDAGRSMVLP